MNTKLSEAENLSCAGSLLEKSNWNYFRYLALWPNNCLIKLNFTEDFNQDLASQSLVKVFNEIIQPEVFSLVLKVKRRDRGDGSGQIRCHHVNHRLKKQTKSYEQYWYHYELWSDGERLVKGSVYIPKAKLVMIQKMESLKLSVLVILEALGKKV